MWAIIVDDGSGGSKIDSIIDRAKTFTNPNNDITYGPEIFSLWSDSERWAIGVAKVNAGTEPDQKFYTRGTPSYAIASAGVVNETIPKTAIALATLKTKYMNENELVDLIEVFEYFCLSNSNDRYKVSSTSWWVNSG